MPPTEQSELTRLLVAWTDGDAQALDALTPLIEGELHRMAVGQMRSERADHLLQPTALVNEAYLRLAAWKGARWQNRAHFFAMASQIMRRVLVDMARRRRRLRREGERLRVTLSHAERLPAVVPDADLVALDDVLRALEEVDARKSRVVELRFFGGLSLDEIAHVLDVSVGTVRRDWSLARAWLTREMTRGAG